MAEFKKLSEVEQIKTASDNATVLIEEGGEIKRVPKKEVGGAGIATAIIKDSNYDNAIAGLLQPRARMAETTAYECINMTFEEAYQIMSRGEPLNVMGMFVLGEGLPIIHQGAVIFVGAAMAGTPCILIMFSLITNGEIAPSIQLYWTADSLSTEMPGGGQPS